VSSPAGQAARARAEAAAAIRKRALLLLMGILSFFLRFWTQLDPAESGNSRPKVREWVWSVSSDREPKFLVRFVPV
jgi:hypothetical protein